MRLAASVPSGRSDNTGLNQAQPNAAMRRWRTYTNSYKSINIVPECQIEQSAWIVAGGTNQRSLIGIIFAHSNCPLAALT